MNELISISRDHKTPLVVRVQIHLGICPYLYGKRKAVDESIEEPMVTNVITDLDGAVGVTNARAESPPAA